VKLSNTGNCASSDDGDIVWGAANIGALIGRSPSQVYHLFSIGALDGAVTKLGHRTFVASRKRLANLINNKIKTASAA
jgi:hypothetical protein